MKQYEKYKDSGVDWIGAIPAHWEQIIFKRIIKKIKDGTHGTYPRVSIGEPFLSAKNVYNDGIRITNNESYISKDSYKDITKNGFPTKGDLLITCVGTIGRTCVYNLENTYAFQRSVAFIRFYKNKAVASFYKFYVESDIYQKLLLGVAKTSAQSGVYMGDLLQSQTVLPPLSEQKQIANYLDQKTTAIDQLIQKKEQLIQLLEEEHTAMINQAVTKGLDPTVPMKDSGIEWLGEVPEHWEMKKIKHITSKIGSGITPRGGADVYLEKGIPLLRSQNVYFDGFRLNDVAYISKETHLSMNNSRVKKNDVLLNITGGSIGRCYYVSGEEFIEANINQHVCILRPNKLVLTRLLYFFMGSRIGQEQIEFCQTGGNREAVNFEQIKNFIIPLPDLNEQKIIINYLTTKNQEIAQAITKTKDQIKLLKEYKTTLISEVVTGKIDVREAVLEEN